MSVPFWLTTRVVVATPGVFAAAMRTRVLRPALTDR